MDPSDTANLIAQTRENLRQLAYIGELDKDAVAYMDGLLATALSRQTTRLARDREADEQVQLDLDAIQACRTHGNVNDAYTALVDKGWPRHKAYAAVKRVRSSQWVGPLWTGPVRQPPCIGTYPLTRPQQRP